MRKFQELTAAGSCLNRAKNYEMLFVLLGRDIAAPATIRFWIDERIRLGKNQRDDPQIAEAWECAQLMEQDYLAALEVKKAKTALDAGR